jgi:hypothetical protein
MPVLLTLCTLLKDLNVNLRRWGTKLTPYKWGRIFGVCVTGILLYKIEVAINHSKCAIVGIIVLKILRLNGNSLLYKGQPIIYNERDY